MEGVFVDWFESVMRVWTTSADLLISPSLHAAGVCGSLGKAYVEKHRVAVQRALKPKQLS